MIDYARLYSLESEQSVIGALLIDPLSADRIGALKPEHCYHESHRVILGEIIRMIASGKPVDVITVAEELSAHGLDEQTGGLAYLGDLAVNTPSAANIARYAEVVAEKRQLRDLLEASSRIADIAREESGVPIVERIDEAQITTPAIGGQGSATITVDSSARALTRTLPICKSDAQQRLRTGDRFRRHVDVSGSVDVVWGARRGKVGGGGGPGPTTPVLPTGDRGGRD